MPATIEAKPARRKFLDAEADDALIDLVEQVVASKRDGYERDIDERLQGIRNWATQRFAATDKRQKLILRKFNNGLQQVANELKLHLTQALAEAEVKNEQRFGGIEVKSAERQAGLMKWMITFFVGLLFTLAGLMFAFLQLLGKP